ncbi:MAG: hypothetical protein QOG03_994 [Actinomycetota bacterium]|jgi:hypothetical protein|nr:hypothetical protein [Actinomycetota bacterium]
MRAAGPSQVFRGEREAEPDVEPALDPIPLPTLRASQRRRRRHDQIRDRRRQGATVGLAALIAVALVVGAVLVNKGATTLGHRGPKTAGAAGAAGAGIALPPVVLAQTDGAGRVLTVTVLAPAAGSGGAVVLVPPGTMTEVGSLGLQPLTQAMADGGIDRLVATTENLLGVRVGSGLPADGAALANLVEPASPLTVDVPSRVEEVDPSGAVNLLYPQGPNQLAAADVAPFLSAHGRGTDLLRLARHDAFWRAWLGRLKGHPERLPAGPPELRKALAAIAAGPVQVRLLPVQSVGTAGVDGDGPAELYQPQPDDIAKLVRSTFPPSDIPSATRPRVRILNGTGQLEVANRVSSKLVPDGIQVVLTGNAESFSYSHTQIVYYRDSKRAMAEQVQRALGVGVLVRNRNATDVVDVTVIVGKDFNTE